MIRLISVALIMTVLAVSALASRANTPVVQACSYGAPFLEEIALAAESIVYAEVVSTGGPQNTQPTLPPDPTLTPTATSTFVTPPATLAPFEKSVTPVPQPTYPPSPPFDFTGVGATVRILTSYLGPERAQFDVDAAARVDLERQVRKVEALPPGIVTPCAPGYGVDRFAVGERHVLVVVEGGNVAITWPMDQEPGNASPIWLGLVVAPDVYARFFSAYEATEYTERGDVLLQADVPFRSVLAAIAYIRGDTSIIIAPETGSAGLRASR